MEYALKEIFQLIKRSDTILPFYVTMINGPRQQAAVAANLTERQQSNNLCLLMETHTPLLKQSCQKSDLILVKPPGLTTSVLETQEIKEHVK